ncbi:hypothetical protein AVEN_107123-1 [Araneus ventricosus]|uniref:Uncharacterized protein n=1 Tax=Araneus ventricosus TaxID=182803 RepID=A0A4Y2QTR2_ARAVE|nr:hypothetical protein AVEN_107123-1 [Araneus ventricosus]
MMQILLEESSTTTPFVKMLGPLEITFIDFAIEKNIMNLSTLLPARSSSPIHRRIELQSFGVCNGNPARFTRYYEDTACTSKVVVKSFYIYYTSCSIRSPTSKNHVVILCVIPAHFALTPYS